MKKTTKEVIHYAAIGSLVSAMIVTIIYLISLVVPEMDYGVFDWIITPILRHSTKLIYSFALVGAILAVISVCPDSSKKI